MRPGPAAIPAGEAPGGLVIHVYDIAGVLLSTSHLTPELDDTALEADGERAAAQTFRLRPNDGAVVMVAYDGDDGRRLTPTEWLTAFLEATEQC